MGNPNQMDDTGRRLSNIDLFVTMEMRIMGTPEVAYDTCDGFSDQHPVCMETNHLQTYHKTYGKKIFPAKQNANEMADGTRVALEK